VTGSIGSGKTSVSKILEELGGYLISADEIAHDLIIKDKIIYSELIKEFGFGILKENSLEINRARLGEIAFSNQKNLDKLNKITHEKIIRVIIHEIKSFYFESMSHKFIILDAPLLIELELNLMCDYVFLIECDLKTRLARAKDKEIINQRDKYKLDFEYAKKFASEIILNQDNNLELLYIKIKELVKKYELA
jgi:dephospho-CoA kinase